MQSEVLHGVGGGDDGGAVCLGRDGDGAQAVLGHFEADSTAARSRWELPQQGPHGDDGDGDD